MQLWFAELSFTINFFFKEHTTIKLEIGKLKDVDVFLAKISIQINYSSYHAESVIDSDIL